jgi:hypothetical protein
LFIFFCKTTYPDAHPVIFVHQDLEERDSQALNILRAHFDFTVITNYMPDFEPFGQYGQSLRWLLWDDLFDVFEGIYVGDIDILILPDKMPLFDAHMIHCDTLGKPFSNVLRTPLYQAVLKDKKAFFDSACANTIKTIIYCFKKRYLEYRLSGLHFFQCQQYKRPFLRHREAFLQILKKKPQLMWNNSNSNEVFLLELMEACGWLHPREYEFLLTPSRKSGAPPLNVRFRPHHGLHLGIFGHPDLPAAYASRLRSATYRGYFSAYMQIKNTNKLYAEIFKLLPLWIKVQLLFMEKVYQKL